MTLVPDITHPTIVECRDADAGEYAQPIGEVIGEFHPSSRAESAAGLHLGGAVARIGISGRSCASRCRWWRRALARDSSPLRIYSVDRPDAEPFGIDH